MNSWYTQERMIEQRRDEDLRWAQREHRGKQALTGRAFAAAFQSIGSQPQPSPWRVTRRAIANLAVLLLSSWMR